MGGKGIMKKYVNGEYIEMTPEEMEELKVTDEVAVEPTELERIEAIEALLLEGVLANG